MLGDISDISQRPLNPQWVKFPSDFGSRFILTVDTEEEFDWHTPISRNGHSLNSAPALERFQNFCEEMKVSPIYLVDYPVIKNTHALRILKRAVRLEKAEIGIHLHPWVSPPFTEELSTRHSFPGNLPPEIEAQKFLNLHEAIQDAIGSPPLIYRAGRYGAGPNTASLLKKVGICIDTSVRPGFDYRSEGGINYSHHPTKPYWIDKQKNLLEIPLTTAFTGALKILGKQLYPKLWRTPIMHSALSRLNLLERIPLTPEGITSEEAIRGIDSALTDNLPLLNFSFHSPSLAAGYTPYVKTNADVENFYVWWRLILSHLKKRHVSSTTIREILTSIALASDE